LESHSIIANKGIVLHRSARSVCHGSSPRAEHRGSGQNSHLLVSPWEGTDCCCLGAQLLMSTQLVLAVILLRHQGDRGALPCIFPQPHSNNKIKSPESKTKLPVSLWNGTGYISSAPTFTTAATQRMGPQIP